MASSQQVEVEAAKFLQKLIQESKDEPSKLATKLFVICQHMKMSGKEHSLPYQVISRAMETVIDQHGLDINALKTSRLPPVGGLGESSNRLKTCDRPESGGGRNLLAKDSSMGGYASSGSHTVEGASGASEIQKYDASASDRPLVGPIRIDNVGQDNTQELISLTGCKLSDHGSPATLPMEDSRSTHSQENQDTKSNKQVARKNTKRAPAKRKRADTRSIAESHNDDQQMTDAASSGFNTIKEKLPSKCDTQALTDRGDNPVLQTVGNEQMSSFAGTSQEIFQPLFERSLDKINPNPLPPGSNIFGPTDVWIPNKFGKQLEARECSSSSGIVSYAANPPSKIVMGQGGDNLETSAISYQITQDNAVTSGRRVLIDPRNQHYFTRPTSEVRFSGNYGDVKNIVETPNIPKDMGKGSKPHAAMLSNMPFKEQHLKQLRAQCLVFLAFRNNLVPRKLHLEIALGESYPREGPDNGVKEAYQEERPSSSENPSLGNMSVDMREAGKGMPAQNPPYLLSTEGWKQVLTFNKKLEGSQEKSPCDQGAWLNPSSSSVAPGNPRKSGSPVFMRTGLDCDIQNKPPVTFLQVQNESTQGFTEVNDSILANTCKGKESEKVKCSKILEKNINSGVQHSCQIEMLSSTSSPTIARILSGPGNGDPRNYGAVDAQQLPGSDEFKTIIFGDTGNNEIGDELLDKPFVQEEGNKPESHSMPLSPPKYGTTEKWILIQQKKKILTEKNWIVKQRKADERIMKCFTQLKETVNSSEDISAKTKSVIELKKLQRLKLQRRLRSEFLNDFFKPITSDMERMKSVKKNKHGRRVKQLEKYELKMKEERMKRVRERQKEFFGELEVHRERLEECFKVKRERWRGFNRHVKEFHKRKERIHREKIDRIQREKINLLKNNDVEGYLRMVQDAKSDRVKQLLKETEKYLQKLGSKLQEAKAIARRFEMEMDENRANMIEKNEIFINDEDGSDEAQHYLESNEKYYKMAHSVKESIEEQPASLQGGKLREYQMNGLRWLVSLYNNNLNGILADEMGLGKTVQVISLICYLMEIKNDRGPFLVVVPSSVLPGWESEISFWAPSIIKISYAGPPEERRRLFKEMIIHQKFNVLLTTYEYLMNKHDRPKLSKVHWHYIIIDEGHRIKNASCKLNAELKHYQSSHRLLLTGTPLQNNLEELWALLNFLLPSIFNSAEDFSQWFNKPFEGSGDNSPDQALLSEEENLLVINRLHQVLRPFVLRRLKHKVENELPEKIERLVRCEASAYQKLLMKRVAENLGSLGNPKARSVHNTVMELRNICNHPYLSQLHTEEVNDLIPKHYLPPILRLCGKLEMLDRLLPKLKATNHRILFFSTMTRLLDVMEDYLYWKRYRYLRLDGHTSGNDRGALIDEFNRPDSPAFIFLLSIRAGGVGVNLQAADTVIIFDTDWNPQVDLQAQARAHRIGQKKDVLVLRLETVGSVEEQVRASAEHKLGVANQSITAGFFDNNTSAEDRREYLESLLREHKKEETAHVLDDDALNDILARSEPEIDIFEAVDKQRREEEMATWQKLVQERVTSERELLPLPSRLVTDEDLKPLYQAIHISESAAGVKRMGEYTGGVDAQNYGRGKRAREIRSYEDQWTEEEFEKLCQADSPESPKTQDSGKDLCHVKETNISRNDIEIVKSSEEPEKLPIITESAPKQSLLQPVLPQLPVKDNHSSAKRGRGRPKRVITDAIPVPPGSSPSITLKVEDVGIPKEVLHMPSMTSDASDKVKEDVVSLQQDICEETTAGSLPSCTPVVPTVAKGRARKPKSGDRGKKQTSGSFSLAQVDIGVASPEGAVVVKNKYHGRTRAHKNAYSLHAHSSSEIASVPTALQEGLKSSATDKSQIGFEVLGSEIGAARVISSSSNSDHLALEQPKKQQEALEDSILETRNAYDLPASSAFELNAVAGGSTELNFSKSTEKDVPVEQLAQSPQLLQKIVPALVSQLPQKSLEVSTSEDVSGINSVLHTMTISMTQEKSLVLPSSDPTYSLFPTNNIGSPVIVRRTSEKKASVTSKKAAARETKRTRASYSAVYADSQMMGVREGNGKQIGAKCSDLNADTQMMNDHMKYVGDMTGQIRLSEEGNAITLAFGPSCIQSENLNDKLEFHRREGNIILHGTTSDSIEGKEVEQIKETIVDADVVNLPSSSTESEKPKCLMDEALDNSSKLSQLTQASDIAKPALSAQVIFGEHGTAEASSSHSLVKSIVPPDSIEGKEVKHFTDSIVDANVVNLLTSSTENEKPKCLMDDALDKSSKLSQLTQASDIAKPALSAQVIFREHGTAEASSSHFLVKFVVPPDSIEEKEVEQLKDSIVDANVVNLPSSSTENEKPKCLMEEVLYDSSNLSQLTQAGDIVKSTLSTQVIFGEHRTAEASSSHSLLKSVVLPNSFEGKEVEQLMDGIVDANVVNFPSSSSESEKHMCLMDEALDDSSKLSQFTKASDIAKLTLSAPVIFGERGTTEASSSHSLVKSIVPPDSIEGNKVEQVKDSIVDADVVNLPLSSTECEKSKCLMDEALDNSSKLSQLTQSSDITKLALSAQVIFGEHGTAEASPSHSLVKSVVPSDEALKCGAFDEQSLATVLPTSCLLEVKSIGAVLDDADSRLTTCDVAQDEPCKTVSIEVPPSKVIKFRDSKSETLPNVTISSDDWLKFSDEDPALRSDVTEVPQLHVSSHVNNNKKSKVVIGASSTCGTLSVMPTVSRNFDGNGNDEVINEGQLSCLSGNLKYSSQSTRHEGELPCGDTPLEQILAVPPMSGLFDLPNEKFVTAELDTGSTISDDNSSVATETIIHCIPNVNSFTAKATPLSLIAETFSTHRTGGTDETVQKVKSLILDVVVAKSDYPVSHSDDNLDSSLQLLDACQEKASAVEEDTVTDRFANIINASPDAPLPDRFANIINASPDAPLPDRCNLNGREKAVVCFPSVDSVAHNMLVDTSSTCLSENPGDGLAREEVHLGGPTVLTSLPEGSTAEEEKIPPSANTPMQPRSPSPVCKDSSVDLDESPVDVYSETCFSASLKPDGSFSSETDASNIAVTNASHPSEQTKIHEGHCDFSEVTDIQQTGGQHLTKEVSGPIFVDHNNCRIGSSSESQNQEISTAAMGNTSLCAFTVAIDLSVCVLPDKRDSTSQANTKDLLSPVLEKDERELVQIKSENEKSLSENITVEDSFELDSSRLPAVGATGCYFVGAIDCDLPDKRDSTSQANTTDLLLPVLAKDDRKPVELKYEKEKSLSENITVGNSSELDSASVHAVGSTECDSLCRGVSNSLAEMLKPLSPDSTRVDEINKPMCEKKASFLKVEMCVTDGTTMATDEAPTSTLILSDCAIGSTNESPLVADAPLDPKAVNELRGLVDIAHDIVQVQDFQDESGELVNMTQKPEVQEVNELKGFADIAHQSVQVQDFQEHQVMESMEPTDRTLPEESAETHDSKSRGTRSE